jgi:spore germination cell wall hydrolase CwlJ-like protein
VTVLKSLIYEGIEAVARWRGREIACLSMLLLGASCVPAGAAPAPRGELRSPALAAAAPAAAPLPGQPAPVPEPLDLRPVSPTDAAALNAAIPLVADGSPRAASVVFRAASALDQQRSLQCLAEAVYYEARSESEDGQRAVAQVVLNRVRHPAYPGSVCGVVYQGPMRPGGGCQFTFTCDGSLAAAPHGFNWARAQRIAAEALTGKVYAGVGHATHYHTHQVLPSWAYRLAKVAVIGAHNFYRMQDGWGSPGAFRQRYAGREAAPAAIMAARLPVSLPGMRSAAAETAGLYAPPALPLPVLVPQDNVVAAPPVNDKLPVSTVREEFRNSGRWIGEDAKPAVP